MFSVVDNTYLFLLFRLHLLTHTYILAHKTIHMIFTCNAMQSYISALYVNVCILLPFSFFFRFHFHFAKKKKTIEEPCKIRLVNHTQLHTAEAASAAAHFQAFRFWKKNKIKRKRLRGVKDRRKTPNDIFYKHTHTHTHTMHAIFSQLFLLCG